MDTSSTMGSAGSDGQGWSSLCSTQDLFQSFLLFWASFNTNGFLCHLVNGLEGHSFKAAHLPFIGSTGNSISSSMCYSAPRSFPKEDSDPASGISTIFLEQVERASVKLTSLNIYKSMPYVLTVADCCGLCVYSECTM